MVGTTLGGRYRVIERIGEGGMGVVYRAHDARLDRDVALKVLSPGLLHDDDARRRMRREAQALARLNDPRIETVHEFETVDGVDLLVTELVPGRALDRRLANGPLSLVDLVALGAQVAEALEAAHAEGLIHRDVKPANVMVTPDGRVKLLDFGLAQLAVQTRAEAAPGGGPPAVSGPAGTLGYMAPECLLGMRCDRRADVYGLGALLFEMATGQSPFAGDDPDDVACRVLHEAPRAPRALRADLPARLEAVILRCLEKSPAARPATAGEVAAALRAAAGPRRRPAAVPATRIALAVAAIVAAAVPLAWRMRGAAPTVSRDRVAVAVFENLTGDPALDAVGRVVADWIALGLSHTGLVDVVPAIAVLQVAEAPGAAGQGRAPLRTRLAEDTGAGTIVSGSYFRRGESIVFQAQVVDAPTGRLAVALDPVEGPARDVPAVIERLRRRVTAALATTLDPSLSSWASVSSRPPTYEAYLAYVEGAQRFVRREWRAALALFEVAAAADTAYAYPRLHAALCHLNLGAPACVDSIVRGLEAARASLAPLDRTVLDWLKTWLAGDLEGGWRTARAAARLAPGTLWGYQSGLQELLLNRPRAARDALRALDPRRGALRDWLPYWETLTAASHMLGDHRSELADARRARRLHPGMSSAIGNEVRALCALGRVAEARALLDTCEASIEEPGRGAGTALLVAARELAAHGHPGEAAAVAERAIAWCAARLRRGAAGEADSADLVGALYAARRWREAMALVAALLAAHPDNPNHVGYLGALAARGADSALARACDARLAAMTDRWSHGVTTYWRADIAALLGDADGAMALLGRARAEGHPLAFKLHADPDFEALRDHPGYLARVRPRG